VNKKRDMVVHSSGNLVHARYQSWKYERWRQSCEMIV